MPRNDPQETSCVGSAAAILLVDDHLYLRRGVREVLAHAYPSARFGEAGTCEEAITIVRESAWDLVLLDLELPDGDGIDLLKELTTLRPGLRVLVMTAHPEERYGIRALSAGAAGYVTKDVGSAQLVSAVEKVLSGRRYVSATLAERLAEHVAAGERAPHELLSDRELTVLRMIARGKTVKAIALELHLSEKTVSTYRARVLEKLHLQTTADLVRYAIDAGLA